MGKVKAPIEYKQIDIGRAELKATNDDQGIIEGYLNTVNTIDLGDDRTMPGAFRKTINDAS